VDPRLAANRDNWNDRVGIHTKSEFYDVERWLSNSDGPPLREVAAIGAIEGKSLVHLQCHFGMDALRWARAGAIVTGVDFSPEAITAATALAERAGLSDRATFVCANVYDAPAALSNERFDVVYVSIGSLCWLPSVDQWGEVVASFLNPGGKIYLHDVHPNALSLDDSGERTYYSYFEETSDPLVADEPYTYTDGEGLTAARTYEWNHSVGEIVMSLISHGLELDSLVEHDWTQFRQFPWLVETASGEFVIPARRPRAPLTFTIVAHARERVDRIEDERTRS